MQSFTNQDAKVMTTTRAARIVDARRDLGVTLLSVGGGALLTALLLLGASLIIRGGDGARGPGLFIKAGAVVGAIGLAAFVSVLAVRSRRGWRSSSLLAAAIGALGVGGLMVLFTIGILLPDLQDKLRSAVQLFLVLGTALGGLGAGVLRGHFWSRPALAAMAAVVSVCLGGLALQATDSMGDLTLSAIFLAAAVPAILLFIALCAPSAAALFPRVRSDMQTEEGEKTRYILFFSSSRLSIGSFVLLWLFLVTVAPANLIKAIHRSGRSLTMANLLTVATAVEAYSVDHGSYPEATTIDALARTLEPHYIKKLPRKDGWGWPLEYKPVFKAKNGETATAQEYVVRSPGRDGIFEHTDPTAYKDGPVTDFDRDLVFANGSFSQWPDGTMGQ